MRIARTVTGLLVCVAPLTAHAQWLKGADVLSPPAVADSLNALRELNAKVAKAPNDAGLRFHVGTLAWTLAVRDEFKPSISSLHGPLLKSLADSSLRLAVKLAPANGEYELVLSRFLRASSDPVLRIMAPTHVDRAIEDARAGKDTALLASSLAERGRLSWLMYDSENNETPPKACAGLPTSIQAAAGDASTDVGLKELHNAIAACMRPSGDAGESDYLRAEDAFREVYTMRPRDTTAFRRLAMLLAEKNRWTELAAIARDRVTRMPADGGAWLALGLAMHRNGQSAKAKAAFDTAALRLDSLERKRTFAFERLLRRTDSAMYAGFGTDQRRSWEQAFWLNADPLWSREGNDPRTEFLARVTFAGLRWTVEEYQVRGADSDRGQVHIRYGPPDGVWTFRCGPDGDISCGGGGISPQISDFAVLWDYKFGFTVMFYGAPTYGTMHFPSADGPHIDNAFARVPSSFANTAAEKIFTMPLRVVRFRAAGDSVDVLAISQAPMDTIRSLTTNAVVSAHGWLLKRDAATGLRDSSVIAASGIKRAIYHVAPGAYFYRVEATAPGTMFAGSATTWIIADRDTVTGFSLKGFGISDLILGSPANPDAPLPARWRGLSIAPLVGVLPRQSNLDLVWETYDLAARNGSSDYSVSVTFQKIRSKSGRVATAILGLAATAVGVDRKDDRVTFKFDRSMPAAPAAFVDRVSLATGETPPGDYIITLEIADKVSGRKTSRALLLTISE